MYSQMIRLCLDSCMSCILNLGNWIYLDNATIKFVVVILTLGFVCVLHKNVLETSVMKSRFCFYEMCLGLFLSLLLEGIIVLGGGGGGGVFLLLF
jgi:hypothetical protein